ncbi:MAG: efflux RND transporter periplasmic adaptor subunit [Bryobacteraceae bacterium]
MEIRAIGNVEANSTVEVKSRVDGQLQRVWFSEGQDVRKGQPLFQIDPREFQQAVREAEAALENAKAAVNQAEANYQRDLALARNASSQAERYGGLAAKGIISREANETYQTQAVAADRVASASKAVIASARAAVQGAEANLAEARLQLSYTVIRAPISGRTGRLEVKPGNLVSANAEMPLVVIEQIVPAFVAFSVPEGSLDEIRRYSSLKKLLVQASPPNSSSPPRDGTLDFLDNRVDSNTGTILLRARFKNADRRMWPGKFVNVVVRLDTPIETAVPTAAVRTAQIGSYVFVVTPDATAEQRAIQPARLWGDLTVVASGLYPGERVVVEGQLRLKPGSKVDVVSGTPAAQ